MNQADDCQSTVAKSNKRKVREDSAAIPQFEHS